MEKLKNILRNSNMSTRPEYYSGRGATTGDLNGEILEKIYQGILKEFGQKPAKAFVKMVEKQKVMSATAFLENLYDLFSNNWVIPKDTNAKTKHVAVGQDEEGNYSLASGMMGMSHVLAGSLNPVHDRSVEIKSHFLRCHGVKPTKNFSPDFFGCYEVVYGDYDTSYQKKIKKQSKAYINF